MFDKVTFTHTALLYIGNYFFNDVVLMIARENQFFFFDDTRCAVSFYFFFFFNVSYKAVNEIKQAVALQNFFPKVGSGVSVRIGRIAFAARIARAVGTLIERHKICVAAL